MSEFCQENTLVVTNTFFQQHKTLHMDVTRWSIPKSYSLYSLQPKMEKLYTVSKNKTGSWLRSWTPYCQIQTEIEESRGNHWTIPVWPKSNPLWLYSGSHKYIQGVRSDRQSAWRTMDRGSWLGIWVSDQDHPQEKWMQQGKMVVWGGLTNSWEKKRWGRQRRKGKIHPFECRVPKNSKEG